MSSVRSAKYVIRPFVDLDHADDVFDQVRLSIGSAEFEAGSVVLDTETLASEAVSIRLPAPSELVAAVERTPVAPIDCGLVVLVSALSNRKSHVAYRDYVRHLDVDGVLILDRAVAPLIFQDSSGFVVTVALVLMHELQAEPLRPHMAGTWIARREFRLVPERAEFSFSPEPLTKEVRKQFGLPERTPQYIRVDGDHLLTADNIADAVGVYLDEEVLHLLQQSQSDALSVHIQYELAVATMGAVARACVSAIARESGGAMSATDVSDHPAVERFLDRLAVQLKRDSLASLLGLIEDPDALEAHLRAAFDVRRFTLAALKTTPGNAISDGNDA